MDENAELDLFRESSVKQSSGWHCISRNLHSRPHRKRSERGSALGGEGGWRF